VSMAVLGLCGLACSGAKDAIQEKVAETVTEKVTEKTLEGVTGATNVDLTGEGGSVDISALPAWLHYPGVKGTAHVSTPASGSSGPGEMWMLQTTDGLAAVKAWYGQALSTWNQQTLTETGDGLLIMAQSPAGDASVTVVVSVEEGGPTTINVMTASPGPK